MKTPRAKLTNDSITTFRYNTRSSLRHENRGISDTDRLETSDAIVESKSRVRKRKKTVSEDRRSNSDVLPIDLTIEILKRLPVKTLTRFLCVSKLWASIIRRPDFMKLFLTESSKSKRPSRLFFTFKRDNDCFFFASNQTQNPGDAYVATYHMKHPVSDYSNNYSSCHDLLCYGTDCGSGLVVYNSTTKQSITLPKFGSGSFVMSHFLGYDPSVGVYKVLCITRQGLKLVSQVLTLGNGNQWRVIKDSPSPLPFGSQICIDGVLYYKACGLTQEKPTAISFDLRSEKFDPIKRPGDADFPCLLSTMINYEGKLAIISPDISDNGGMVLWVLEDALKHNWSRKVFVLPNSWTSLADPICTPPHAFHCFVNVTDTGELILAPTLLDQHPYYVLYYDPRRNSVRKVVVEGFTEHYDQPLHHGEGQSFCFLLCVSASQVESLVFP